MRHILLQLLLLFIPFIANCGVLKGKITDEKGEALPFATVFVQGTTLGTSANAEGEYQLTLQPGEHQVVCQYISFKQSSVRIRITGSETVTHNFKLAEQTFEMNEFVMKSSEDPAYYIMRKVIARRGFHQKQVETFQTGIYLKGVLKTRKIPKKMMGEKIDPADMGLDSTGKGFLYLCEEIATYYRDENRSHTVIHSVRESGNPNGLGFSQFPPVIDFYSNIIRISGSIVPRGFISPVSDNALNYYRYKLEGDFKEGAHTIYKISVTPRRQYEPLLTGTIYVVDNDWAIHSLDLFATKKSNIELLDTLRLEQIYLPLEQDLWVIKQQLIYPAINILGFDMNGYFVTVYNDQKVNLPIPDSIFNEKIVGQYDRNANKKDTAYWAENRPVPLLEEERTDYHTKDSIRERFEDPAFRDSVRRKGNRLGATDLVLSGYSYWAKEDRFFVRTNSLISGLVNYNTVEGVNIAPKFSFSAKVDSFNSVTGQLGLRYGFANEHFNGIARVGYVMNDPGWRGRYTLVGIEAGKYVFQFNPANPIDYLYNSVATLFYRRNYLKIYERWNGTVFFRRNFGNGLSWSGSLGFQQRLPLDNTTDYSFIDKNKSGFTDNTPVASGGTIWEKHNAVLAKLSVSWQPGYTYTLYPDYKMPNRSRKPVFTLSYQKGIPNILDSKTDFDKWTFGIRDDFGLKLLGRFEYNLSTGGFLNDNYVSIPDLNHLNGNELLLASPYLESFQMAPYYLFSNQEQLYGEAHVEWHLEGFLTNKIPLFRQMRWHLVLGSNAYYANEDFYHLEAFAGVDNLGIGKFRLLRLDVVQAWNSFNQQSIALRLGLKQGPIRFGIAGGDGEW